MSDAGVDMIVFVTTGRAARHGSIATPPQISSSPGRSLDDATETTSH
jgi:hypothetical protein